jgi:hypothetical protein
MLLSSDNDYIEYAYTPQFVHAWEDIVLSLQGEKTNAQFIKKEGSPDLKRIIAISVTVHNTNTSGEFWLDDIYTSDPVTVEDTAHWYEGTIKITKPLMTTQEGTPVLSDIMIEYVKKGHGNDFYTIGQPYNDISEDYSQAVFSCNILPYWHTSIDYLKEQTQTDSLNENVIPSRRGTTSINQLHFISTLLPPDKRIPQIDMMYNYEQFDNQQEYKQSANSYDISSNKITHQAIIGLQQTLNNILGGDLSTGCCLIHRLRMILIRKTVNLYSTVSAIKKNNANHAMYPYSINTLIFIFPPVSRYYQKNLLPIEALFQISIL